MKYIFTSSFFLAVALTLHAQTEQAHMEVVGTPALSATEIVARRIADGRFCAGIQILSDMEGFSYDAYLGVVGGIEDKPGQDIVYLDPAERALIVYHTAYPTLTIILNEFGIRLEPKHMWVMKIKGGAVDILPVSFVIEPQDAEIFIDKKQMKEGPTFQLQAGEHQLRISRENYQTVEETMNISPKKLIYRYQLVFKTEMVLVEGGNFKMGDTFVEGDNHEKPVHQVTLNNFYLSKFEVTFSEFNAFCEATGRKNPSDYGYGAGLRAMNFVNWYDAVEYCNWRSEQEGLNPCYRIDKTQEDPNNLNKEDDVRWTVTCDFSANGYRLPTEAEWEYAARERGRKVRFGNGKDIADPKEINFLGLQQYKESYSIVGDYRGKTMSVGSFAPNALKLYDMSGNVWEWCWGWYAGYEVTSQDNPGGPESGEYRVLRGGSWVNKPGGVRAAHRTGNNPGVRGGSVGFRLAKTF